MLYVNLLPAQQVSTDIEAGAKTDQCYKISLLKGSLAIEHVEREGYAGARNVARLLQRAHNARIIDSQTLYRLSKNALICLMKNEVIDVVGGNVRIRAQAIDRIANRIDAEFEDATSVHRQNALPLFELLER